MTVGSRATPSSPGPYPRRDFNPGLASSLPLANPVFEPLRGQIDADGDVDALVGIGKLDDLYSPTQDRVMLNDGTGSFTETTTAGGIILAESAQRKPTSGASPDASDDDLSRPKPCATSTLKRPRDGVCASKFWRRVFQVSEASSRRRALKTLPLGAPSSPSSSR